MPGPALWRVCRGALAGENGRSSGPTTFALFAAQARADLAYDGPVVERVVEFASARVAGVLSGLCLCLGLSLPAQAAAPLQLDTPALEVRGARPNLHLQPESARLVLALPTELMPPPDLGLLGSLTGEPMDPNKHWDFRTGAGLGRASLGAGLRLSLDDRGGAFGFDLALLPRAAVAELRFDPVLWFGANARSQF